jgi:myo-inositol-1(or 4)-monophosphatase
MFNAGLTGLINLSAIPSEGGNPSVLAIAKWLARAGRGVYTGLFPLQNPAEPLTDLSALAEILPRIEASVREAGEIAMEYFHDGAPTHAEVNFKHGGSPVTEADLRIDHFLRDRLQKLAPDLGWMSEETADSPERLAATALFVVDPIDGTRGFAAGDPCFAICVALVIGDRPAYGVVHAPALDQTFTAAAGSGARRNGATIAVSRRETLAGARLAAPHSFDKRLARSGLNYEAQPRLPSLAMRILRVACGEFDAALARENACDWDIAAADLILEEAGGVLTDLDGNTPRYNRASPKHPALAAGPAALQPFLIAAARGNAVLPRV